ncbi:hypothetical protein BX666DRAFT_2023684 [Dichotomocladium elegans]|nr:hypothetical protein BX666DRAFT_2023684 [Dichotomocladium elegans]
MSHREATTPRRGKPGGNNSRNQQRRPSRDEARAQSPSLQHSSQTTSTHSQFNLPSRSTNRTRLAQPTKNERGMGESQNIQLLRRVFLDEDDLQRRNMTAIQLIKSLEEGMLSTDVIQVQQEGLNLIEMCLFKQPNVQSVFENVRPSGNALKESICKLISTLALCACRPDIVFMWIFGHLQQWEDTETGTVERNKTKEFKLWLLRLLRQTIIDAASDHCCEGQLHELSARITAGVIAFLDAMDSPDYLPDVLQVLVALANCCPLAFSNNFQDIIDLLVGWHIDPTLPEQRKSSISDSYVTFRAFWENRLPFAFELLQHFLSDMQELANYIIGSNEPSEIESKWNMCESLLRIKPQEYLKGLMKLADGWDAAIDQSILEDLLNPRSSPLFSLRAKYKDDKRLNSGILVFLRILVRLAKETSICLRIMEAYRGMLGHTLSIVASRRQDGIMDSPPTLHQTAREIMIQSKSVAGISMNTANVFSSSRMTDGAVDTLFISYLLLDAASVWPSLRSQHFRIVMETLVVLWQSKCRDAFDACLQLLIDYCIRLDDPAANIRLAGADLISALNPFITADMKLKEKKRDNGQNAIMATPHTGTFRPSHFEIIMVNLGMHDFLVGANAEITIKNLLITNGPSFLQWAERLFYHCDSLKNIENAPALSDSEKNRLEVQIYNASYGSATNALPSVPRSSLAFFRTNSKICKDYYSRIRPKLLAAAKMLHDDAFLIRNGLEGVGLLNLTRFFVTSTSSDLIYGIQSWYKRVIKSISQSWPAFQKEWHFPALIGPIARDKHVVHQSLGATWFHIAGLFATAQHESAIKSLKTLHEALGRDEYGILDMLDNQALDYYTCIEDYDAIKYLYNANGSMFSRILSQELMVFANTDRGDGIQPPCNISDFYASLGDLNILESLQIGRLIQFQRWISTEGTAKDTQKMIDGLLGDRARLSLEGALPTKSSMVEMQLYRQSSSNLIRSLEHYLRSDPSKFEYDTEATKTWGRIVNYLNHHLRLTDDRKLESCIAKIQLHASKAARKEFNTDIAGQWLNNISNVDQVRYQVLYEKAKGLLLNHNEGAHGKAIDILSDLVSQLETSRDMDERLYGKACLAIAMILKEDHDDYSKDPQFMNKLRHLQTPTEDATSMQSSQSPIETAITAVLRKPVDRSTKYSKPWFQYATYHYKQGWKILDDLVRSDPVMPVVSWAKSRLITQLKGDNDSVELEKQIRSFLQKHSGTMPLKDDVIFMRGLQQYLPRGSAPVVSILQSLYDSVIDTFRISASAYFQYLSVEEYHDQGSNGRHGSTSMIITATLRLLRILIKYGDPLQHVFLDNIERVRIEPWKRIIPQLFARLNHPARVVQKVIAKLLDRICAEYPREIIYDVIVSHTSPKTNSDTKQLLGIIANQMMTNNRELWISTQRMAEELEKITVLWEERWSYKIASLAFNVMELMPKLDQEVARLENNREKLTQEQIEKAFFECYDSVMKFVISAIDKLLNNTIMSDSPKSPHEQWFTKAFGTAIKQAFVLLQNPNSMATYRKGWDMFIQINRELVIETHKVRVLELQNISPYLASLRSTQMCVPGVSNDEESCVIESFDSSVVILPTKTKPKKLDLHGSDGRKYSYLFKGLEDLHLDERVMQLLNTVNGLLIEDKAAAARFLKTRTYAVIPLSDHSGMIQWVNDATPLFALYKKWQRREQAAQMLMANDKVAEEHPVPQRPTEIFMKKIESALRAEGLRVTTNRRHWPQHVLKKVFLELVKETPGDLLSKEIWCSSSDVAEWLRKSTSFSRSLAVMSVIGYIIGLGDRHLDNMLVDYQSGEIIHIDYNVCFEKGRQLRVPELVPFRLTQNLFHALGITGVDGVFRNAAEETLRVLRKHKEVLMTLLDAFVYDPLVHWANEAGEAEERQMMELQANLVLVAARLVQYDESQRDITETITRVLDDLQRTYHIDSESILDEGSEDDGELENEVEIAKKNILAITEEFKSWNMKHVDVISALMDDTKLQQLVNTSQQPSHMMTAISSKIGHMEHGASSQQLITGFFDWSKSRAVAYQHCAETLVSYRHLAQPVVPKLLNQDVCGTWPSLEELSSQSYQRPKAEELKRQLQTDRFSQALQGLESRAFNFRSHIAQIISSTGSKITQLQQMHEQLRHQFQVDKILRRDQVLLKHAFLDCLAIFEGPFRRLDTEEGSEATAQSLYSDFLPEILHEVESRSHSGCFGQSSYIPGLLASTAYLESFSGMLEVFLRHEDLNVEIDVLKATFPCARSLDSIEDDCLMLCEAVLQQLLFGGDQTKILLLELLESLDQANDKDMLCKKQSVGGIETAFLFDMLMKPFENIDRYCDTLSLTRNKVVICILKECIKHVDRIPSEGWTSSILSSWAMTYNATISGHIEEFVRVAIGSIVLPMLNMSLQSLRQALSDLPNPSENSLESQQRKEVVHAIQQISIAGCSERLLKIADGFRTGYTRYLEAYDSDIQRFHWFNAPYILKDRPLYPSQIAVSLSKGTELINELGHNLQQLNEEFSQWHSQQPIDPERGTIYQNWEICYQEEVKLWAQMIDVLKTINHLEIFREGYTQAISMKEDIISNLLPFISSNESEAAATIIQEETPMLVAPEMLKEAQDRLSRIDVTLTLLKSPLDGILSLLESISIIEVDDDSELKSVHQSAKTALDEYQWIQTNMKEILGEPKTQNADWTLSRLRDAVAAMGDHIQSLFVALHTLEDYGLDRQGDDQKQVTNTEIPEEEGSQIEMGLLSERGEKPNQRQSESDQGPVQTNQTAQRQDAQVLSIMRRIRSKLEGKDFGVHQKMSISEQVEKSIEQAMQVDNLCMMYEGWTSWV